MESFRRLILLTLSATLLSGCSLFEPVNNNPDEQQQDSAVSLKSITATGYTSYVYQNEIYSFDGQVTAYYSDSTSKVVTNYTVSNLDTSTVGNNPLTISYTENKTTASLSIYISVLSKESEFVPVTGVNLSETSKTIEVGECFTLTTYISPSNATNKIVKWTSSNENVASVSEGQVTGKAKGTTTITATTENGGKTAICNVKVIENIPDVKTISPEEAVEIIKDLTLNVPSSTEYYVKGIVTDVEKDQNGFNGSFLNTRLKFRSVRGNDLATTVDDINGKEVIIFGYLENYNDIYQIPYLPANVSPTGLKYNPTLVSVKDIEEDTVDVTNIVISPVSKTLKIGEKSTLTANILPDNASDKSVTWSSKNTGICKVSQTGEIEGVALGSTQVIAKSSNNLEAICNVTVINSSTIDGDLYTVSFNHAESDGQTALTTSTIKEQIISGSEFITSFSSVSRVYKGMYGLKMASQNTSGSFTMNIADSIKNLDCNGIILDVFKYGTSSTTITVTANGNEIGTGSSADSQISIKLDESIKLSTLLISSSRRTYLSKVTFVCNEAEPIPVTAISIPSTKSISTGSSEKLTVTYTPSNANRGKGITWTSSNTAVATVSDGTVNAIAPGTSIITARSEEGFTSTCTVTVSNIAVTSVSLSSTSETLGIGGTKQLTATVSPSNATNKNVTWSSNNSAIASVSSNGLVTAKAIGNATITVKTSDGNKTATCNITVTEVQKDAWTIMIYMCGADLESESGLATSDIKEILSVANQPDNVNIVIETGGAKSWSLSSSYLQGATSISASSLSRWHVANKKLVLDKTYTYASMGLSSTLQSFIEYGLEEYPAEKTGVIFWNHGGAMYGCCYDEKKNDDSLLNSEMKSAFSKAITNTGTTSNLEFVGYDTCLTQVQDIAEFNSAYFNYMIASEESESGYGWDYDTWIDDVYAAKPTETILKSIVDGFITDNGGASSTRSDQTLSYLDLTKMSAYKSAFESFASALNTQLTAKKVTKATFASWMSNNVKAFAVDGDESEKYFCLFDVKDMLNKLSSNSNYNPGSSYISAVNTAFANLVKYSVAQKGAGNAYGLGCIYCQSSDYSYNLKSVYDSYETNFSNWLTFLKSYSYLG